jgi:hypothetical protein
MPTKDEIKQQLARETERRTRMGVPAFAGGILFFLSTIVITAALSALPRVGLIQGLSPALHGLQGSIISPRAPQVKAISHNALGLIAGGAIKSAALVVLVFVLVLLLDATRFRRPETFAPAHVLLLVGGLALALLNLVHYPILAVRAHHFAIGHDYSGHAVDQVLTQGPVNIVGEILSLLAALAFVVGMIATCVNAIRVGLVTRWLGIVGIVTGVLLLFPLGGVEVLEIVPAFFMIAMGVLFMGRWPNGDPPAWADGEARPWPSRAELRAEHEEQRSGTKRSSEPTLPGDSDDAPDITPEPAPANGTPRSSRKRRGKRGSRR